MTSFPAGPFDRLPKMLKRGLGKPAVYQTVDGETFLIRAIVNRPSIGAAIGGTPATVETAVPTAFVDAGDLTVDPRRGDTLSQRGTTFTVLRSRPAGNGGVELDLAE